MNSAELARVREVTPVRKFEVLNNGEKHPALVAYEATSEKLYCTRHARYDSCTCTARVRLSGILTNTVKEVERSRAENGTGAKAPVSRPFAMPGSEADAILGPAPTDEEINARIARNEERAAKVNL